jgi:hypothetical protein
MLDRMTGIPDRRLLRRAAAIVACLALGVGCSLPGHSSSVQLVWPGDGGEPSYSVPSVPAGSDISLGSIIICTKKATGPARVTSVSLLDGNADLSVTAFSTRPSPYFFNRDHSGGFLEAAGSLQSQGFDTRGAQFVKPCRYPHGNTNASDADIIGVTELAVTLRRTGSGTGRDAGVVVHYRDTKSAGHSLDIPYSMILCSPADTQSSSCGK